MLTRFNVCCYIVPIRPTTNSFSGIVFSIVRTFHLLHLDFRTTKILMNAKGMQQSPDTIDQKFHPKCCTSLFPSCDLLPTRFKGTISQRFFNSATHVSGNSVLQCFAKSCPAMHTRLYSSKSVDGTRSRR